MSTAPSSITTAARLMYGGAVLSLVSAAVSALTTNEKSVDADASSGAGQASASVQIGGSLGAIIGGLILAAVWVWMARKNEQGRQWARITGTVLGAINILLTVVVLALSGGTGNVAGRILDVLSAVLAVVIIVLLFRPESTRYFEAGDRATA